MESVTWEKLSLIEQLSHVGAEIHRAEHWEKKRDKESRNKALERAIDLMDSILNNTNLRHRTREITRLREVVCDCYADKGAMDVSLPMLDHYFITFAIYSRRSTNGNKLL